MAWLDWHLFVVSHDRAVDIALVGLASYGL